jgi:hypothetical protein
METPTDKGNNTDCSPMDDDTPPPPPVNHGVNPNNMPPADSSIGLNDAPPADNTAPVPSKDTPPTANTLMEVDTLPAYKDVASNVSPVLPAEKNAQVNSTPPNLHPSPPTPSSSPSELHKSCPGKYEMVMVPFETKVKGSLWKSAVDVWLMLEHTTSFQMSGKALSATGCPAAVFWWVQRRWNTA